MKVSDLPVDRRKKFSLGKNKMSDIGLYVSAFFIWLLRKHSRLFRCKVVSVLFVFGYPFILEKNIENYSI